MSADLDRQIEAYLDGTLSAEDAVLLAQALRSGSRAAAVERITFAGLLAQALDPADGDAVARSVLARIEAQSSASAMVRSVQRSIRPRRKARAASRLPWLLAAAALVAVAMLWWLGGSPQPVASLTAGTASISRAGSILQASAGMRLLTGDRITADSSTTVHWPDGSELVLAAGSGLTLTPGPQLERGTIDAAIVHQPAGAPFTVATTEAQVEVLGTRFRLVADAGSTRCDLHAGAVRLTRLTDGRSLQLAPGQSATVAPGHPLAAWNPLFPATGLDGWEQQYGTWTNDGVTVRGTAVDHGKVRIFSERVFSDLEMTCRMRVTGVELAEIQISDYNWFFEIPAREGAWTELHLRQHGTALTCTADGVVLTARPGDGLAPRSGRISFYVRPGGSLELRDCRILQPEAP